MRRRERRRRWRRGMWRAFAWRGGSLAGGHEEWNAVFEELARLAWERFEEAFFDSLCGFGFGFGLAESGEECGDGVVVEGVEEAGAGDGLVHGVGRPEIELNWV